MMIDISENEMESANENQFIAIEEAELTTAVYNNCCKITAVED